LVRLARAWVVRFVKMHCGENGRRRWLVRVATPRTPVSPSQWPGNVRGCPFESGPVHCGPARALRQPEVNRGFVESGTKGTGVCTYGRRTRSNREAREAKAAWLIRFDSGLRTKRQGQIVGTGEVLAARISFGSQGDKDLVVLGVQGPPGQADITDVALDPAPSPGPLALPRSVVVNNSVQAGGPDLI